MSQKFKAGDRIKWVATPRDENGRGQTIKCVGTVESTRLSTFGGSRKGWGAVIKVTSKGYKAIYGKDWAFVSFDNIEKA